jgi:uncharacterized membrane protein YheB (UPF0754 family)
VGNAEVVLPAVGGARSDIDKMGLGQTVLRLRRAGLSYAEIAVQVGLNEHQIKDWINKYLDMPDENRQIVEERSVFNIAENLQDIFTRLHGILEEVKHENKEMELKVLDKLLRAQDQAARMIEKIETFNEQRRFREIVLDLLDKEAPGIKQKALANLGKSMDGVAALRPFS